MLLEIIILIYSSFPQSFWEVYFNIYNVQNRKTNILTLNKAHLQLGVLDPSLPILCRYSESNLFFLVTIFGLLPQLKRCLSDSMKSFWMILLRMFRSHSSPHISQYLLFVAELILQKRHISIM